MTARAAPSPRLLQPYSPRRPSPLGLPPMGFPPLAPHMAFLSPTYPATPDRRIQPKGPMESRVPFPPEARRPLAGTTQRPRSQPPPAPLTLDTPHHPPTQPQHNGPTQPGAQQDMAMRLSPPSPTPSETSSLSLYSAESTKNFPIDVVDQKQQEEDDKSSCLFCACLSAFRCIAILCQFFFLMFLLIDFRALFGSKPKNNKTLAPPAPPVAAPAPQMVQTRRRPSPLNL